MLLNRATVYPLGLRSLRHTVHISGKMCLCCPSWPFKEQHGPLDMFRVCYSKAANCEMSNFIEFQNFWTVSFWDTNLYCQPCGCPSGATFSCKESVKTHKRHKTFCFQSLQGVGARTKVELCTVCSERLRGSELDSDWLWNSWKFFRD